MALDQSFQNEKMTMTRLLEPSNLQAKLASKTTYQILLMYRSGLEFIAYYSAVECLILMGGKMLINFQEQWHL